jgi:excisionase family DNA binding protein
MANRPSQNGAMAPADAARRLGIGRTKLYELIGSGALRSFRIGKARRIRTEDIEALRESDLVAPKHNPAPRSCNCAMVFFCASRFAPACRQASLDGCHARTSSGETSA